MKIVSCGGKSIRRYRMTNNEMTAVSGIIRKRKTLTLLVGVFLVVFISAMIIGMFSFSQVCASVTANATVSNRYVNVRTEATSSSALVTSIYCGHRVQTLSLVTPATADLKPWYQVKFVDLDGVEKTGYIFAEYLLLDSTAPIDPASPFEISILAFPDSYKVYLRALHEKYPNWVFVPYETNLNFTTVLAAESSVGRSLIEDYRDDAWQSTYTRNDATSPGWTPSVSDAYNWLTDTYIPYDASRWVNASSGFVAYSMDPRNFISDTQVFQFLELSYDPLSQNIETVQSLLTGTFMESNLIDNAEDEQVTYAQAIMDAAEDYSVNPYFLVARIKQEILLSTGLPCGTASGTYPGYEGYYNFYNIGAISNPDPVVPALIYAKGGTSVPPSSTYLRPWDSQYKAILGGAMWIENGYISETRGQDTLYFQRWDVIALDGLYWHQYMTSTEAPVSEAIRLHTAYEDILDLPLVFKIPVYTNMPTTPVLPPEKTGNPNNWLTSIFVEGQVLTPSFDPNIFEYDLIVGNGVSSVNVNTTAASFKPAITGTGFESLSEEIIDVDTGLKDEEGEPILIPTRFAAGVCNLEVGGNLFVITVTAENGDVREYALNIIRLDPSAEPLFTSPYTITDQYLSGIAEQMTSQTFIEGLAMADGATAELCDSLGNVITDNTRIMRTGDRLRVYDSEGILANIYDVILYGDPSGDGRINSYDLTITGRHVIKETTLTGLSFLAADVDHSGRINSFDLTMIGRHIIKEQILQQ